MWCYLLLLCLKVNDDLYLTVLCLATRYGAGLSLFHAFAAAMHGSGENLRQTGLPERLCRNVGEARHSGEHKPLLKAARNRVAVPCTCGCSSHYWFTMACSRC